jgi:hypothetical protein
MNDPIPLTLRDIHTPTPDFWPPALGWWILVIAGLVGMMILSRWLIKRFYRWRRRHMAIITLNQLLKTFDEQQDTGQFAAEISMLLRRIALYRFPRDRVAGLSGKHWLTFLDETGGEGQFTHGPGQILAVAPYQRHPDIDKAGLIKTTQHWIKQNA